MNNRLKKILILVLCLILGILMLFDFISIPCLFKTIFKIPCPGCGMTRAFKCIIDLDFIEAFNFNILSIPLFIFLIFMFVAIIIDIIKDSKILENKIIKILDKYWIIAIIFVIASLIVNIIREI